MRALATLFLVACSGQAAPTGKWCGDYVADLNQTLRPRIAELGDAKPIVRQNAASQLRLALDVPEQKLAGSVCGHSMATARDAFVHAMLTDLGNLDTTPVAEADVADLQRKFDAITQALMK